MILFGLFSWKPVLKHRQGKPDIKMVSLGFIVAESQDAAVIWRGPKKNAMVRQLVVDVDWGELDYLLVDTPPGSSDEHISSVEMLQSIESPQGSKPKALIVTSPQAVSAADALRQISFCRKVNVPIIGVVENFSTFQCQGCHVS